MEYFIWDLDNNYNLDNCRIKKDTVVLEISRNSEVECPYCGVKSSKIHSCYIRETQDLPV